MPENNVRLKHFSEYSEGAINGGLCACSDKYGTPGIKGKGIRYIVLYPPKCSHDLPPLAGLYTREPFQFPEEYSRAAGSI